MVGVRPDLAMNVFRGTGVLREEVTFGVGIGIIGADVAIGFKVWAEGISTLRGVGVIMDADCCEQAKRDAMSTVAIRKTNRA